MHSWEKFWAKDIKRKKKKKKHPNALFEEPEAKSGYCICPLHTTT